MSLLLFAAKGFALGFAVAAPLGPIGALCINRTLQRGFWVGLSGGLGTAFADAFYGALAALGFAAFSAFLATIDGPMRLVGGLVMIWLGWKGMQPKPPRPAAEIGARDLLGTIGATFLLTIANPTTILSFAVFFAGLGLASAADAPSALVVVAGVFAGSLAWWIILTGGVSLVRHKLSDRFALWVGRLSGGLILAFGLLAVGSFVLGLVR
ncbi:putative LysE/RhtB family amino acid efflux pump [Pleomorphomonas diazotrophica]|uniref:LysE family translocator n=1 Tax=Pleomorphomonas diazotrophica TaxID=1166257 RepID=UPI0008E37145|nr:LysE family transporter [Pleomorphomonas diazotrophica]SFM47237.1 putative LysE/RhtB family amino acid efflux pump [Pleomorphomonas diazotrophica]